MNKENKKIIDDYKVVKVLLKDLYAQQENLSEEFVEKENSFKKSVLSSEAYNKLKILSSEITNTDDRKYKDRDVVEAIAKFLSDKLGITDARKFFEIKWEKGEVSCSNRSRDLYIGKKGFYSHEWGNERKTKTNYYDNVYPYLCEDYIRNKIIEGIKYQEIKDEVKVVLDFIRHIKKGNNNESVETEEITKIIEIPYFNRWSSFCDLSKSDVEKDIHLSDEVKIRINEKGIGFDMYKNGVEQREMRVNFQEIKDNDISFKGILTLNEFIEDVTPKVKEIVDKLRISMEEKQKLAVKTDEFLMPYLVANQL